MNIRQLLIPFCLICLFSFQAKAQTKVQIQEQIHNLSNEGKQLLKSANQSIVDIDTDQLQQQIKDQPGTVLIDVRTAEEIKQVGTIGLYQNVNIPRGWIEFQIADQASAKDTPIVVYCGINARSPMAAKTLMDMGYTNVKNYASGYFEWKNQGLDVNISDMDTSSILYRRPKEVIDGVYSAIGATQPATYENSGHNNNLSFVIADDAVVVFNAGGSYLLAESMHEEIKKVTSLPVKYVVLENAQGHAILGSNYWKAQGAEIIAHEHTAELIDEELSAIVVVEGEPGIYERAAMVLNDKLFRSEIIMPDRTFSDTLSLPVKGRTIELLHLGPSHSPDDIQLWMPDEGLLISGDFTFNTRLLPILDHTDIKGWIQSWDKLVALNPRILIPGHGDVTDLATVQHFTKDYLEYMLDAIVTLIDDGGELIDAYDIDQSAFQQWKTFRELSVQNADRLFRQLEFDF
jgi:rhodanese-related sulfurtransferase/glyoxylase-like metal-dependent hydrolase (beta-lactamase superfamily II)